MEIKIELSSQTYLSDGGAVNEMWGMLVVVGFWGWVLCTIGFIIKAFPHRNIFARAAATRWGGGLLFFYCLWVMGMMNA